jgi:hypothetical protein
MKAVPLPPITQADAEAERDRLFDDTPAPAFPRLLLETEVIYAGRRWRVRFADTPIDQAAAILDKKGCQGVDTQTPTAHQPNGNGYQPAPTGAPICPTHAGRTMKPMQHPDKQGHHWMCTAKVGDGWCAERA